MDILIRDLKNVPALIWKFNNYNEVVYVDSNEKGKSILLNVYDKKSEEISLSDLSFSPKKINKIESMMFDLHKKKEHSVKKIHNAMPGMTLKIINHKDDVNIYMLLEKNEKDKSSKFEKNIKILPLGIGIIRLKQGKNIKYISENNSFRKVKCKSFKDKLIECILNEDFSCYCSDSETYINIYKIKENSIEKNDLYLVIIAKHMKSKKNFTTSGKNEKLKLDVYNNAKIEINTIYGMLDLFREDITDNNQVNTDYLSNIQDACTSIEEELDNYYYISMINNNTITIKKSHFDLRELLYSSINKLKEQNLIDRKISIKLNINYDVDPYLIGDITKISYIFETLLKFVFQYAVSDIRINISCVTLDDQVKTPRKKSELIKNASISDSLRSTIKTRATSKLMKKEDKRCSIAKLDIVNLKINIYCDEYKENKYDKIYDNLELFSIPSDEVNDNEKHEPSIMEQYQGDNKLSNSLLLSKFFCKLMSGDIYNILDSSLTIYYTFVVDRYTDDLSVWTQRYANLLKRKKVLIIDDHRSSLNANKITTALNNLGLNPIVHNNEKKIRKQPFDMCIVNLDIFKIYQNNKLYKILTDANVPIIGIAPQNYNKIKKKINKMTNIELLNNPITDVKIFNVCISFLTGSSSETTSDQSTPREDISYESLDVIIIDKKESNRRLLQNIANNISCNHVSAVSSLKRMSILQKYNVVILNVSKLDVISIKIIKECMRIKSKRKFYIIGVCGDSHMDKNKLYNLGIDLILIPPMKVKDIKVIFDIISKKLSN